MPKVATRRSPRARRPSRSRASRPREQFLLHCSIAAVLTLLLSLRDAESMRSHHHDAGQGHARQSKRADTASWRDTFSVASAAASSCSRVEGLSSSGNGSGSGGGSRSIHPSTRTVNNGESGRGATARPAATAFVAPSGWPAAGMHICSALENAASGAAASSTTRRRRRHARPTQEQQPRLQDRVAGAARLRHSRAGSWAGSSNSRRSDFHGVAAFRSSPEEGGAGRHGGGGGACAPPALWCVVSGRSSGSNMLAPRMSAGGGQEGLTRPPLLITIGPQCAGKTSLLRALAAKSEEAARQREGTVSGSSESDVPSLTDVTIDDHPSVYHKIPTGVMLDGCGKGSPEDTPVGLRPLSDRLREPGCVETRLVALRLVGGISAEEFADRLSGYGGKASRTALATLCSAVETAVSERVGISTPTVDVFVRENLFPEAISSSQERLALAARAEDGLVAWGNTNTQARDYLGALEQAELTGRPVRFLRWGYELPVLSLEELSRRNVYRFASTGRYVEVAAVESALSRVDRLYASAFGGDPASLALAAGFEMDAAGMVYSRSRKTDRPRSRGGIGGGGGNGGETGQARRRAVRPPGGGDAVALAGGGGSDIRTSGALSRGSSYQRAEDSVAWGVSSSSSSSRKRGSGSAGAHEGGSSTSGRASAPPRPVVVQPLPAGPVGRLAFEGSGRRRYDNTAAGAAPPGLAQEWAPRGGSGGGARAPAGVGSSRRWDHYSGADGTGAASVPPTVMFGNEWGRKRGWRRTGYTDDDIDPTMSSCFFRKPANSTGVLRRSDLGEEMGADLEEMELVRRIRSFRQRR